MLPVDGFIFDLDGVLCSTDSYHYAAWKQAVEPYGIPCDPAINNRLRGVSRSESLEILLENYDGTLTEAQKAEILAQKNLLYIRMLDNLDQNSLLPGVLPTLLYLKGYGYPLAVGSSSKNARTILCKLGICHIFDCIIDGTMLEKSKPDPEVFLRAARGLSMKPERCAVIEDAHAGIQAAKRGGFYAIATGDAAASPLADTVIARLDEIIVLLLAKDD